MNPYTLVLSSNVMRERLEVEINKPLTSGGYEEIALVFRTDEGWEVIFADETFVDKSTAEFESALTQAKEMLTQYVTRGSDEAPDGLTAAGLAAWLMEKKNDAAD